MVQGKDASKLDWYKAANKFPNTAYEQYRSQLVAYVDETEDRFRNVWESSLRSNVNLLTDADQDRVERDLERVEEAFEATIVALAMKEKVKRMASATTNKTIAGLRQELQVILGEDFIPPVNRWALDKFIQQTIDENVSLISSIASDQHGEIKRLIYKGARSGWSMDELEGKIFNQFEVSRGRANVIALDQTGSLQGSVNRHIQQKQLNLEGFRWLGIMDNKIRPEHRAIASNGGGKEVYLWSNPPHGKYPGMDVNCRCWAAPVPEELMRKFGGRGLV